MKWLPYVGLKTWIFFNLVYDFSISLTFAFNQYIGDWKKNIFFCVLFP